MMDASSAIAIATRSGVGSVRHLAARYSWVQREVESNSFSVEKVAGPRIPADLGTKHEDVKVLVFCRDFVELKAAHLDQQEEQEAKNMVNNIFTGLMLLPATKRHSILKLLVTAKGYETRPLDSYDMTPVKLEAQSCLSLRDGDRVLLRAGDSRLRFLVGLVAQEMDDDSYEYHCHPSFTSIVREEHDD